MKSAFPSQGPSTLIVAYLLLLSSGCVANYTLRKDFAAEVSSSQPSGAELAVSIEPGLGFRDDYTASRNMVSLEDQVTVIQGTSPLLLTISNPSTGIITVDWDHSVFVDSSGNSYKLLYPNSGQLDPSVEAIKKPPTPVIAPRAKLVVPVLPEATGAWLQNRGFFLPRVVGEKKDLRVLLATAGGKQPHTEVALQVVCKSSSITRSPEPPFPGHGKRCLASLGCAEGTQCLDSMCVDPNLPPPERKKFRIRHEPCAADEECVFSNCSSATKTCGSAEPLARQ